MKYFVVFCAVLIVCESLSDNEEWVNFKRKFNKNYKFRSEHLQRFTIFQENLRKIKEHNTKADEGLSSFKLGINQFADMTAEEFSKWLQRAKKYRPERTAETFSFRRRAALPTEIDWRSLGAVTEVKDQGDCGSCWAFSATGGMEAANFFRNGKLVSFSEQNLMDCSKENLGCDGGLMTLAFDFVLKHGGIEKGSDYSYEGKSGVCRFNKTLSINPISGYKTLVQGDEYNLQIAVASRPVCAGIEATYYMQLYKSGILNDRVCDNDMDSLNHAVLIVGYGEDSKGTKFWIVKNSWGSSWGQNGYVLMSRNKKNQCGIATLASYPIP